MTSVKYSYRAARGLAFLKKRDNAIDVFVEDASGLQMWNSYIRRHLPPDTKFSSAIMLGGRNEVLKAHAASIKSPPARPTVFLIDADFDLLLGVRKPAGKALYRMPFYCIENALIGDRSVAALASIASGDVDEESAMKAFRPSAFIARHERSLAALFCTYAAIHGAECGVKGVSRSVSAIYLDSKRAVGVCSKKAIRLAIRTFHEVPHEKRGAVRRLVKIARAHANRVEPIRYVSGKDYLMPLLHLNACKLFGFKGSKDQFERQLAASEHLPIDAKLRRLLASSLKNQGEITPATS